MSPKKSDVLKDAEDVKEVDGVVTVEATKTEEPIAEEPKVDKNKAAAEKEKNDKAIADLALYVGNGFDFMSVKGDKVVVPPLGGKREKKAILALLSYVSGDDGMMNKFFVTGGNLKITELIKVLTAGGEGAWDCLADIAGFLLNQPVEWVSEHLMLPDMIQVVRPFFLTEGKTLIQAFKG